MTSGLVTHYIDPIDKNMRVRTHTHTPFLESTYTGQSDAIWYFALWTPHGMYSWPRLSISHLRDYSKKRVLSAQAAKSRWAPAPLSQTLGHLETYCLEKEMATHSSVLAWRIPWTREPGGLPSMGSHRVGHDWSGLGAAAAETYCAILIPSIYEKTEAQRS